MSILVVAAVGGAMFVCERLVVARRWPDVPGWRQRVLLRNAVQAGIVYTAGVAWDGDPRAWNARGGFGPEREHRLWTMLRARDVHDEPAPG